MRLYALTFQFGSCLELFIKFYEAGILQDKVKKKTNYGQNSTCTHIL